MQHANPTQADGGVLVSARDYERVRGALTFIPSDDRGMWVRIGMALKEGFGGEGFDLWDTWARESERYNDRDARDVWRSVHANGGVTLGTLYHEAKAHGWSGDGALQMPSPEELAERRRVAAERALKEEADQVRRHAEARDKARKLWEASTPAEESHQYLRRKFVFPADTLREIACGKAVEVLGYTPRSSDTPLTGRLLIVPVKVGDALSTVEMIDESGRKSALAGGLKAGGYWAAQELPNGNGEGLTLLIGEGVATVLSAKGATGHLALAALSCGNLELVAKAMRTRYLAAKIVILADLVKATGEPAPHALQAARAVGGHLAIPDFGDDRPEWATDFNDMAVHRGREEVAERIRRQMTGRGNGSNGSAHEAPQEAAERGEGVAAAAIDEVLETFRKWLYIPDEGSICVPLAAIAANLMEGDPVWAMIVGPPSGGKTEVIVAIASSLPYVRLGATLTEAALLSGTPKKQMAAGSKGGLLREIGGFGILALKDFTSVLSMNHDARAQLLAALREVFDGSWTRHVGTDGGRTLAWSGKLGLIAGCTAAIDSFHGVMSVMGERFLLYRLPNIAASAGNQRR